MSIPCHVLSLLIAGLGILSIAFPETYLEFARQIQTPAGMYFGAGFRILFGASLLMAAAKSRVPDVLQVLGWIAIVGGLFIPVIGLENLRSLVDVFLSLGHWAARIWGVVALSFGLAIAYAVAPRSRAS